MTSQAYVSSFAGRFAATCLFVFMSGLALMGCLNDDNLIGENCYDEILNNGEELVDCGGPICDPCDDCENGVWDPLEGEQWVDCGGPCEPCGVHNNGILDIDAGEIGIDCGCADCPSCAELCGDGLLNGNEYIDNPFGIPDCGGPECEPCPTCDDEILNGDETGIDCGGNSYCEDCSCLCDCTNGIQDGTEFYIDCGSDDDHDCGICESEITWYNSGIQYFGAATASLDPTTGLLTINGASPTGANVNFSIAPPVDGWENGYNVLLNMASVPQTADFNNPAAQFYTTLFGGTVNVSINYINYTEDAGVISDGIVVGTFSGSVSDALGSLTTLSQGSFQVLFP